MSDDRRVVIAGAGPAGLTAAYELVKHGVCPLVLEKANQVGGLARTEVYKGYRFDMGGHRFYTKVAQVQQVWQDLLGEDLRKVRRLSRIYFRRRFFDYPISLGNTLVNLGLGESALVLASYLQARLRPSPVEENFEQWVCNRFGRRLFETFFKTYTEKVWGIPCDLIQADWAAQRIRGLSLVSAVVDALVPSRSSKTLIREFDYPTLGPGLLWERMEQAVTAGGGQVHLGTALARLRHDGKRVTGVVARRDGRDAEIGGEQFLSTMPLSELVCRLEPPPPDDVLRAARALRYRSFLMVGLVVNRRNLFRDNWVYVHDPEFRVGRIQDFRNWSAAMIPEPEKTAAGMEYFCDEGDELWTQVDETLIALATRELVGLGLLEAGLVEDGVVFRQPKAYPVYDREYRRNVELVRSYLDGIVNLQSFGRNGMHRYNNLDHSMLAGMLAARNVLGEHHDLWSVNTEQTYLEGG